MFRAVVLSASLTVCSIATAADVPKDITPEARAAWLKKWGEAYSAERAKLEAQADEGRSLAKFKSSEKEGKKKFADATAALKTLDARPWLVLGTPVEVIGEKEPKAGAVCHPATADDAFIVSEVLPEGTLVECVIPRNGKAVVTHYLLASPVEAPKKKDAPVKWATPWYCAGTAEVKGKTVPVLYRFKIEKDDYPKQAKP